MKYFLLINILIIVGIESYSQELDSTIFTSEFERKIFQAYSDSLPVKAIDVLISYKYEPSSAIIEKQILAFCNNLESKGVKELNRKKQIKEIYSEVHKRFLKKYEEEAYFGDIFTTGNYNCVTASALYTLVLDYFKIDYVIKETPNHVYLIVDPSANSFLLETTLPSKGVYQFDDRFKKNYVDYLLNNKIISETEYRSTSLNDLFRKHYESDKTIKSLELAALQFYNKGIFAFNVNNYKDAAMYLEKSSILYPSSNVKFLYSNVLQNLLIEQNSKKKFDGKTLAKYANTNKSNNEALQISKDHFREISNEMVINHPDIKAYQTVYDDLIHFLNDSINKNDYSQVFHEIMAYYYYLKKNYDKVFYHAAASYQINPDNLRNQQFLTESLMNSLEANDKVETMHVDTLMGYAEKFPFLLENEIFIKLIGYCLAQGFMESGNISNSSDVLRSLEEFHKYPAKLKGLNSSKELIEIIYGEAASNCVRHQNYDMAEMVLEKGLNECPQSEVLKSRLKTIKATKGDMKKYINTTSTYQRSSINHIVPPKYNADEVNASVKKYLTKCWNIDFFTKEGKTKETKIELLKFIFYADNKMKFKTGTEEHWGTWKISPLGPTLILKSNEDQEQFSILIYEVSASRMRGIMFPNTNENKKIEFTECE